MRLMKPVIEKERSVTVILYELLDFSGETVCHFFVFPPCSHPAFHISYPRDSVHYGIVMSVAPLHFQHFRMVDGCRFSFEIPVVIHIDGIILFKPVHIPVLHEHCRNPVVGGCYNIGIVEADFSRSGFYSSVPVNIPVSHPEMPFAYGSGDISEILHHFRQGKLVFRYYKRRVAF